MQYFAFFYLFFLSFRSFFVYKFYLFLFTDFVSSISQNFIDESMTYYSVAIVSMNKSSILGDNKKNVHLYFFLFPFDNYLIFVLMSFSNNRRMIYF